jgi:anaerobic carbon-monoxide dehydrogenase iron sulfur subunit
MKLVTDLTFSEKNTRTRRSLVANPLSCTGCRICETTCSLIKTGQIRPELARLHIDREPFEGRFVPNVCHHCSIPYCMNACPVEAIGISEKDGLVLIEKERCNGCGSCREACPYGMILFDGVEKKASKCDLCGGHPQCVKACPMNALGIASFEPKELK